MYYEMNDLLWDDLVVIKWVIYNESISHTHYLLYSYDIIDIVILLDGYWLDR